MRVALANDAVVVRARRRRRIGWGAFLLVLGVGLAVFGTPRKHLIAVATGTRAPTLEIGIAFKDLHPIHQQRSAALASGRWVVSDANFAPATLEIGPHTVQAKLRLAEGPLEALAGEKWPMRLRVAKGGHLFGQRALRLRPPSAASVVDALFLEHLERAGVLSARLLFVDAIVNGRPRGTMALSELPSTELLERQQRRDGVVVRIARDARVVALEPDRIARSRKLTSDFHRAVDLVSSVRGRTRPADRVFDTESMGRFLAVANHWNRLPTLGWDQLRFYLNPLTSRLEPVGVPLEASTNAVPQRSAAEPTTTYEPGFSNQMLASPSIRAAFEIARSEIRAEFEDGTAWALAADRERGLRRLLERDDSTASIDGLASVRGADPYEFEVARSSDLQVSEIVPETPPVANQPGNQPGTEPLPARTVAETLERHPFLDWEPDAHAFRVRAGTWSVRGSVLLPEGAGLRISAATVLRFEPRAGLIARGPLQFEGSPEAPVVLEGPPGTKRRQVWSGVYVVESAQPSHWKHVVVRNTGGFQRGDWSLPGGVVFRNTHVDLEHCEFRTSLADDALNLVRSTFSLRDIVVHGAASDAVDFDYSVGTIERAEISQAKGDGFDLGGSRVDLIGARLRDIEDKAISVGERSELIASGLEVDRASIGIASKNSSRAEIRDSEFRGISLVALVAYRNQVVYESGSIVSSRNRFEKTAQRALAERGSRIIVDGVEWPTDDISIASVAAIAAAE